MSYYEKDCLAVGEAARADIKVFRDVVTLVLLSIQQPWQGMPAQFADVREHGSESIYLFGSKRPGYEYTFNKTHALQRAAIEAHDDNDLDRLIIRYLDIPGLGLVKASFLAQLTIGDGACLDSHNQRRIGITPATVRLDKQAKPESILAKVSTYNSLWRAHGDSAYWWNTWCDALAGTKFNKSLTNGEEVSAIHRLPLS